MSDGIKSKKHFFTNQKVRAPYGTFIITSFKTLRGEKYAQLKEVSPSSKPRDGEVTLPLSILVPQEFFVNGHVFNSCDELQETIKYLDNDALLLERSAESYRLKGDLFHYSAVKNNSAKSRKLASDLKIIECAVYP